MTEQHEQLTTVLSTLTTLDEMIANDSDTKSMVATMEMCCELCGYNFVREVVKYTGSKFYNDIFNKVIEQRY